jgi:hypothetical protein
MMPRIFLVLATLTLCSIAARAGDGLVQLTTADPSCPDNSANRLVDCENGTITDNDSGLVWLQNASCLNSDLSWQDAMLTVAGLSSGHCGLTDNSSPGDWRLPTKAEWEAMVADTKPLNCTPKIPNDAGTHCWADMDSGSSFIGVEDGFHWSANSAFNNVTFAWFVNLFTGFVGDGEPKSAAHTVWPVRGGQ